MKRLIAVMLSAAALAVAFPAGASAAPSANACFGQFVSTAAQHSGVGGIVSFNATADDGHPGLGQDFIPSNKAGQCL